MPRQVYARVLIVLTATALLSCGPSRHSAPFESAPPVKAPATISESFGFLPKKSVPFNTSITNDSLVPFNYDLTIAESSLEKEFLLQGSMILQPGAALGSGLKSRIVAFRARGDQLIMLEATAGHSITTDTPQNLVLATFPIKERIQGPNGAILRFDFNKGMAELFLARDWRASDLEGSSYQPFIEFQSSPLRQSFLDQVEIENNHLILRQVGRLNLGKSNLPVEVKYYLSPYKPNLEFKSVQSDRNFDRRGFFETAAYQKYNQAPVQYYSKFDEQKPIVFAISSNTPDDFKQAVRDGVLYWNKAFGKEIVQVINAPAGVVAPNVQYNVIQWVNWDDAGFAYADAQMDPRTGETLHAQVYFTSAFAVWGKFEARRLLNDFTEKRNDPQSLAIASIGGFQSETLCHHPLTQSYIERLNQLISDDVDDAVILKAAQDYVREVAAHEIGHTLGLRHNFAGSLAANYSLSERENLVKSYFTNKKAPEGMITTSSVMEYQRFEEAAITGDFIGTGEQSLSYDEKAIKILYQTQSYTDDEMPLFCTDSQVGSDSFLDCATFDAGTKPISYLQWFEKNGLNELPRVVLYAFIAAKAPAKGLKTVPLNKVTLFPVSEEAQRLLQSQSNIFQLLTSKSNLLSVRRQFSVADDSNEEEIERRESLQINEEINELGGWTILLAHPDSATLVKDWDSRFAQLLEKNRNGIGFGQQTYEFSDEDIEFMKKKASPYFARLAQEIQKQHLSLLAGVSKSPSMNSLLPTTKLFKEKNFPSPVLQLFNTIAQQYLYSIKDTKIDTEIEIENKEAKGDEPKTKKVTVSMPIYTYPFDQRKIAGTLFRAGRSESPLWGVLPKRKLLEQFRKHNETILTVPLESIKAETLNHQEAALWILEQQTLLNSINLE